MDIEAAIQIAQLLITSFEALSAEIDKAKAALASGTAQLKTALVEAQQLSDQLAADRKAADADLDKKFDQGGA